jgi:hypothetical protein
MRKRRKEKKKKKEKKRKKKKLHLRDFIYKILQKIKIKVSFISYKT